jgi:hypothetical protein
MKNLKTRKPVSSASDSPPSLKQTTNPPCRFSLQPFSPFSHQPTQPISAFSPSGLQPFPPPPSAPNQAGGLKELSRWLSEAWRATPPEPNIKVNASRRDARNSWYASLASLRDAVFLQTNNFVKMFFLLFSALPQAGGLKELSRWLSEAWRATPPEPNIKVNASRRDAREIVSRFLASLRDVIIFMLGSGGIGRIATSTTG